MKLNRNWVFLWAAIRLPLLGLALYFFQSQFLRLFEEIVNFLGNVDFLIFIASTSSTRLLLVVFFASGLAFWYQLIRRLKLPVAFQYGITLIGAFAGIHLSFLHLFRIPNSITETSIIVVVLAVNTLPYIWLERPIASSRGLRLISLAGVGLMEGLFPQTYILWLNHQWNTENSTKKWAWLSGVVIASLAWMFIFIPYDNQRVFTLAERLHANPAVEKFMDGSYNWVELNPEHHLLYVVGRSTNYLLAFDIDHLDQPPKQSSRDIGKTQSFGFNPTQQEIYVYEAETHDLLYMDALTLEVLRIIPVPDLAPGDVWIRWLPKDDIIVLSSEADQEIGVPLYVFNRESGDVLATLPFPTYPTEFAFHTKKSIMYFSSFKDTYLAVWDMEKHEITKQVEVPSRTDRMVYSEKYNEIWLTTPLTNKVLRFDAETLKSTGDIRSRFGVRTLAIDTQRNLLLAGNFINNRLDVVDPATGKKIFSFYLGPWIRTIALDTEQGNAYVSTARGLFKVNYVSPHKK